ncbi:hypothetical protein NG819_14740 [Pseudarthrobacter sp. Fe7]|nr:hypothetical protein NG819_14740 [Pseudarthrobacter sp. Fe7]
MSSALEVLELRVHGVRNTPPYEMLGVEPADVVPADHVGIKLVDNLAGFYKVRQPLSETSSTPDSKTRLEAYSWGKLDRFAPNGFLGKSVRALYNVGWFLIAPFGFANAAYWARVLKADDRRGDGVDPGTGAALVRLFSLLLTLLLATAIATTAMDFIAVQCFHVNASGQPQVCDALPHWFDGLRGLVRGQRLAAVSPFPIVAVALLAALSLSSDVRFRTRFTDQKRVQGRSPVPKKRDRRNIENRLRSSAVLAAPRLWIRRVNSPTGVAHIAASVLLVTFLLAADLREGSKDDAGTATTLVAISCLLLAAVAGSVMYWGSESVRAPFGAGFSRMAWAVILLLSSFAVYLGTVVVVCRATSADQSAPFTVAQLVPTVLVALLAILATSGSLMRLAPNAAVFWGTLLWCCALIGILIIISRWSSAPVSVSAAFGICAVCLLAVAVSLMNQRDRAPVRPLGRQAEAWHGLAPAVMMYLSLLLGAFYSSAIVVGVGNWLQAGGLLWQQDPTHPLFRTLLKDDASAITIPFLYWAAGGVMVVLVLAAVVILGALMLCSLWIGQGVTNPSIDDSELAYKSEIMTVRRRSALLQRGERVVELAAGATMVGVLLVLTLTILHEDGAGHQWLQHLWLWNALSPAGTGVATSALTAAGVLIVGVAISSAAVGTGRPLGLLWDLVAWLPRAGHPFGPACYSERVVPELANRMLQWLTDQEKVDDPAVLDRVEPARRILLATHSLGAVLGIAALYHLAAMVQHRELETAAKDTDAEAAKKKSENSCPGSDCLLSVFNSAHTSAGSSPTCGDRLSSEPRAYRDHGIWGATRGKAAFCPRRRYRPRASLRVS